MARTIKAGVAALLVALVGVASPAAGRTQAPLRAVGGACGLATADRLVESAHLGNAGTVQQPVAQVLCGAFLGPGSSAMVVSLSTPGCGTSIGWVLYAQTAAGWRKRYQNNSGAFFAKAGMRLRAWQGVLAANDPHCFPSSWRSRLWHWNGSRMVPAPWHKSGPPPNPLPGAASG
jgi:hypothetical protein